MARSRDRAAEALGKLADLLVKMCGELSHVAAATPQARGDEHHHTPSVAASSEIVKQASTNANPATTRAIAQRGVLPSTR